MNLYPTIFLRDFFNPTYTVALYLYFSKVYLRRLLFRYYFIYHYFNLAGQEKLEIDLHKSSHCSPLVICSQTEELCFVPSNEFEATNSNQRFSFLDNINMFGSNSKKPFGLWSNVLAADVVDHMLEERNKNGWKDVGGKYVNTLLSSPSSSAFQEFKGRNATVVPLLLSHGYRQPSYNINYYSLPMLYRRAMFMLYGLHGQWDER